MEKMTYIYLVENCYGDPNKVYIGKTKNNLNSREWYHKKNFGNLINIDQIDIVNSELKKDWKPLETYWIHQFRTWGFDVQDINEGGGGPESCSKETRDKISSSNKINPNCGWIKGKKRSKSTIDKMRKPKNHGIQLSKALKGKPKHKGFGLKQKISKPDAGGKVIIEQFDLNNIFIKEWPSGKDVQQKLGILRSSISQCLKGKTKTAGGFKWKYK